MSSREPVRAHGRTIRQERGRRTYDALIATGFRLLGERDFGDITIAELAREAGYSVGAFYSRFHSKDEFLDALVSQHLRERTESRQRVLAESSPESIIEDLVTDLVSYYWGRRRFWRAALLRGMRDQAFWKPLRDQGKQSAEALLEKLAGVAGRELTETERMNVRFAYHVALGTVNNSIVNRPGPVLMLGRERFIENLSRAFRLVSGFDALLAERTSARRK